MTDPLPPMPVCLKAAQLRKLQVADNVQQWLADANNVYVGRKQRVFIHLKRRLEPGELLPLGAYLDKNGHDAPAPV